MFFRNNQQTGEPGRLCRHGRRAAPAGIPYCDPNRQVIEFVTSERRLRDLIEKKNLFVVRSRKGDIVRLCQITTERQLTHPGQIHQASRTIRRVRDAAGKMLGGTVEHDPRFVDPTAIAALSDTYSVHPRDVFEPTFTEKAIDLRPEVDGVKRTADREEIEIPIREESRRKAKAEAIERKTKEQTV